MSSPIKPHTVLTCKMCGGSFQFVPDFMGTVIQEDFENGGNHRKYCCSSRTIGWRSPHGVVTECGTCNAPVIWADTTSGKRMPVDAFHVEGGNVDLTQLRPGAPPVATVVPVDGARRFQSHFVSCRHTDQHRTNKAGAKKDAAVQQADDHAPDEWKAQALQIIHELARHLQSFTADDVWEAGLPIPPTPSALGGVMRRSKTLGYCKPTDRMIATRFERRHHEVRVWESCIFVDPNRIDFA